MQPNSAVHHHSAPEAKIALFRSLFRGRDDLYARRFVNNRSGASGFAPACSNEWIRGICEKPRIKCAQCRHQQFIPVTDEAVRRHLAGQDEDGQEFVMGVYPMLRDETCYFLALKLNKASWPAHARSFVEAGCHLGIPVALERSRSGQSGRIWFFFTEAIPAILARKLGFRALTETTRRCPEIGLDSYDRFLPDQDTLPLGAFGSLVDLPLQKRPRRSECSVFLDDNLVPFEDQWAFLSQIPRMNRSQAEQLVHVTQSRGSLIGATSALSTAEDDPTRPARRRLRDKAELSCGPLPRTLDLHLGNEVLIEKSALPPAFLDRLIRLAAFPNPEFEKLQAMRLPTYREARIVCCARDDPHHIGLPRGCLDEVIELLAELNVTPVIKDERFPGRRLDAPFRGALRPDQQLAAEAMLAHDTGVLSATTAFGKTVIAAWLIANRGVNTLVLVHRRQLQEQWIDRLSTFLALPARAIGRIGGGCRKPQGSLDVAVIQSLVRRGQVSEMVRHYGQLIVDECHHLSARTFEQVARAARPRFIAGLSATITRKDGRHPVILMQCGPVRHRVDPRAQTAARPFEHTAIIRPTSFQPAKAVSPDVRVQFHDLYNDLIADADRNALISTDVVQAVRDGRSPIVLTERNDHLDDLAARIASEVCHLIVLRGGMSKGQRDRTSAALAAIPPHEDRVLLATGRYIGEGFDDARLDTLFLTLPVSWHGTIAQYVGRLHRLYEGKREVRVYDYADLNVSMFSRMFDRRCRGYEAVGYAVQLPASAVPGWPADVQLPVDPAWKSQYAQSVRRLIRDGVDSPLAHLFVHVSRTFADDAEGVDRARSATEAFLYRRLESMPETTGRVRLNSQLPIAFDGSGAMEVDFLFEDERLVVELDGGQHLGDAEAYRRDRRKDARLQENGYLVLRFLAQDLATRLDEVLDAILRALSNRRTRCEYSGKTC
jgi:superfamily II DNA or RNA helicase/very-short-patch-repair endonuclease